MSLWFIAAAVAYFIKGMCGFANTLVFTSILSFGTANSNISPIDLLLKHVDAAAIKVVFGVVVIVLGAEMLLRECRASKSESSKFILAVIGVLSGMLCGLFGVGALLAAYVGRVTEDSESF